MKTFILAILIATSSYCAKIDSSLFVGENVSSYFQKVGKDINSTMTQKLKTKETIELERATLKKLKQIYFVKNDIKTFKTITFDEKIIDEDLYLKAFYLLGDLHVEINRLQIKKKDIQKKLFALKNIIEKSIQNEENGSLLNNQLQYAFYKISQEKVTKSLKVYTKIFEKEFSKFQKSLPKVILRAMVAKTIIKHTEKEIDSINQKKLLLKIDKDSEALRGIREQKEIITKEKNIQEETDLVVNKKTKAQILLCFKWLKERNQKEFLIATKNMESSFETLSQIQKDRLSTLLEILITFRNKHFNKTAMAIASTKQSLSYAQNSVNSIINKTLFVYEEKAFSIKTIMTFILILFVGMIIAKLYKNIVDIFRKKNRIKSLSTARRVANSGYYLIILGSFFFALNTVGLDTNTIFIIIGAILLWLALGLQGFISNYAMGILIKIDRSIRIGDHVELDNQIAGVVDDMDLRSITIQTSDFTRITIPNSRFISGEFINHSIEDSIRRIHVPFSVDKNFTLEVIEKKVLQALDKSDIHYLKTVNKKAEVIITDINRRIVRYSLLVWVKQKNTHDISLVKSSFLSIIQKSLVKI